MNRGNLGGDPAVRVPTDIRERGRQGQGTPRAFPGAGPPPRPQKIALGETARTRQVPPPYVVRPPQAREVNVEANATGYNNLNTPQVIAGSTFAIPTDNVGIIRSVVLSVNNLLTTSALVWRLRFDGVPVQGWNALTVFPRNAGSVSVAYGPDETFVFVPDGITIDVEILVGAADPNTYQAGVAYHGWYYDKKLAAAFEDIFQP